MMIRFFNGLLVLAALLSSFAVHANDIPATTETPANIVSIPVVQALPATDVASKLWLDGRASLIGGFITTSQRQFEYAEGNKIPVVTSSNFAEFVSSGYLQKLEGPNLRIKSDDVVPYVLPETKIFIVRLAFDYGQVGCGELVITSALRLQDGAMPSAASSFSVHPRGMAVDVRVNGISEACEAWLNEYLLARETELIIDATREHWKMVKGRREPNPHFHIVVPIEPTTLTQQVAQASLPPSDQSH